MDDRLHDDRGDLLATLLEERLERIDVVERQHDEPVERLRQDAIGDRVGGPHSFRQADDIRGDVVVPAVVRALELDHEATAGRRAGKPDRVVRRLRARGREQDPLGGRDVLLDLLGELDLELRGARADDIDLGRGLGDPFADAIVSVTEDGRAERRVEVDVLAAVGVPDVTALRAREDPRWVEEAEARRHAARDDPLCALRQQLRPGGAGRHVARSVAVRLYIVDNLRLTLWRVKHGPSGADPD